MKFEAAKMFKYQLSAQADGSPVWVPFDWLGDDTKRAALRAIAEHLGPDATIAALGTDANAKQFADAQTREVIRAAGYDPDQVGAAEVIEKLSGATLGDVSKPYESIGGTLAELESAMASAHGRDYTMPADTAIESIMMLIEQRDTARAQLREWRETVGPIVEAFDEYDKASDRIEQLRVGVVRALRQRVPRIRRLLSATPDEQQGPVEPMVPARECERLREKLKTSVDTVARAAGEIEALRDERDAALKRVEELEEDVRNLRISLEHCTEANNRHSDALVAERERATRAEDKARREAADADKMLRKLRRAETAVEAFRQVGDIIRELATTAPLTPPNLWAETKRNLALAARDNARPIAKALADYDAANESENGPRLALGLFLGRKR